MATHSCSKSVVKSVYQPTSVAPVGPRLEGAARQPPPPSPWPFPGRQSDGRPSMPTAILPSPVTLPCRRPLPGFDHLGLTSSARLLASALRIQPPRTHPYCGPGHSRHPILVGPVPPKSPNDPSSPTARSAPILPPYLPAASSKLSQSLMIGALLALPQARSAKMSFIPQPHGIIVQAHCHNILDCP